MILDDVTHINNEKIEAFIPKVPHTITKRSKSCEMCHANKILFDKHLINKDILKGKVVNGSPLSIEQLEKMRSKLYKKERADLLK